jgi:hypothetical protein
MDQRANGRMCIGCSPRGQPRASYRNRQRRRTVAGNPAATVLDPLTRNWLRRIVIAGALVGAMVLVGRAGARHRRDLAVQLRRATRQRLHRSRDRGDCRQRHLHSDRADRGAVPRCDRPPRRLESVGYDEGWSGLYFKPTEADTEQDRTRARRIASSAPSRAERSWFGSRRIWVSTSPPCTAASVR